MGTHNEAKSSHPELLLSFHVEDDTQKNEPDDKSPENITKIVPPTSSVHSGQRHPNLVPRLCSEEGLIQIGPEDECSDTFSLSILIGTANNLEMVICFFCDQLRSLLIKRIPLLAIKSSIKRFVEADSPQIWKQYSSFGLT